MIDRLAPIIGYTIIYLGGIAFALYLSMNLIQYIFDRTKTQKYFIRWVWAVVRKEKGVNDPWPEATGARGEPDW